MKKALMKDSIKEIKNTYKRFISILLMAFLGVGFFAGMRASSPDMVETVDKYYTDNKVYDIQILSTLGLTNEDLEKISTMDNVEEAIGTYEKDGKLEIENKEIISKIMCIEDINKPILLQGEMPKSENECLVEQSFFTLNNKNIGDTIDIEVENAQNDDGEEITYLKQSKLKIVGIVQSPLYISRDRGTSNLGSGKIDNYIYISKENINAKDIYTSIYIKVKDSEKLLTSSKEYENYIENTKNEIEEIKEQRENARYESLKNKANEKINEAQSELDTQKQDANRQIEEAQKELNEGKEEIQKAENELAVSRKQANTQFANAEKQIKDAKNTIAQNEAKLKNEEEQANKQIAESETKKQELQTQLTALNSNIAQFEQQYNLTQNEAIYNQIQILKQNKKQLEDGITQINAGILSGRQQLENGKQQIEAAKDELQKQQQQYQKTKTSTNSQLEKAKQQIENSKAELQKGEEELQKSKEEFNTKIKDAENKLQEAREKIEDIEHPTWYILDRNGNSGYNSFIQDTKSVDNIAKIFPIVFFIIATLISLTSMTRMVEEQRVQIGTLKALRL